jgi:hypothetical protein
MMESLYVGVGAWIIQDGNYTDFAIGQKLGFALEFYPDFLKVSDCRSRSADHMNASRYKVCGQVIYRSKTVWVLDAGFLAYQNSKPPKFAKKGTWVEGEVQIGIDPFMYSESLNKMPGMPPLTCEFRIDQIFLETTPWMTTIDENGRTLIKRNEQEESYVEIAETDAWRDDGEHAHYVLKCVYIKGPALTAA